MRTSKRSQLFGEAEQHQLTVATGFHRTWFSQIAWSCRLTTSLMQHGRNNGKKLLAVSTASALLAVSAVSGLTAADACRCTPHNFEGLQVRIVRHAFDIVHLLTDSNPIQVLVDAIINRSAPLLCSVSRSQRPYTLQRSHSSSKCSLLQLLCLACFLSLVPSKYSCI